MAVEYERAKQEAREILEGTILTNLKRLHEQEQEVETEFSFVQELRYQERGQQMRPTFPVAKQFSMIVDHQRVPTWNRYSYKNGIIRAEKVQHDRVVHWTPDDWYKSATGTIVDFRDNISPGEIPFDKFTEVDLLDAAKTIEEHLPKPVEVV